MYMDECAGFELEFYQTILIIPVHNKGKFEVGNCIECGGLITMIGVLAKKAETPF